MADTSITPRRRGEDASEAARPPADSAPTETSRQPAYEFPGCRPVRISRDEIVDYDGRIEFWDASTEIAMVCEPTTTYHELPGQRLRGLAERIAAVRGSPIETFGTADLLQRDAKGDYRRILQADQIVYLHPRRDRPQGRAVEVDGDVLPDVVVEVDYSTDVYRGKLWLYESWGFPEVWVEVPDKESSSRPRRRLPGLTIHVLEAGRYRTAEESLAFPGWTAAEIHRALNEPELTVPTVAVLQRVATTLSAREGTGPDDDPWLRQQRQESRAAGRAAALAKMARAVLESRGLAVTADFADATTLARSSEEDVAAAAVSCASEADFLARLARR